MKHFELSFRDPGNDELVTMVVTDNSPVEARNHVCELFGRKVNVTAVTACPPPPVDDEGNTTVEVVDLVAELAIKAEDDVEEQSEEEASEPETVQATGQTEPAVEAAATGEAGEAPPPPVT